MNATTRRITCDQASQQISNGLGVKADTGSPDVGNIYVLYIGDLNPIIGLKMESAVYVSAGSFEEVLDRTGTDSVQHDEIGAVS